MACCILHNFCEIHNEEYICNEDDVNDAGPDPAHRQMGGDSGANIRDTLCAHFSALQYGLGIAQQSCDDVLSTGHINPTFSVTDVFLLTMTENVEGCQSF